MPPESCTSNPSPLPPEPAVDLKAELPGRELGDSLPSLVWGHQNPLSHTGGVMLQTTALPLPRLALSLRAAAPCLGLPGTAASAPALGGSLQAELPILLRLVMLELQTQAEDATFFS